MEAEYIEYLNSFIRGVNKYNRAHKLEEYPLVDKKPEGTHIACFSEKKDKSRYMFVKVSENGNYLLGVFPEAYKALKAEAAFEDEINYTESVLYVSSSKVKTFRTHSHMKELTKKKKQYYKIKISIPDLKIKDAKYAAFQLKNFYPKRNIINDCASFTEYMLTGKSVDTCVFKPKDFDYSRHDKLDPFPEEAFHDEMDLDPECVGWFGNTNRHNVRLAMIGKQLYEKKVNQHAVVERGDALAQIFTCWFNYKDSIEDPETGAITLLENVPYHSVPVLEVDGKTFITAEADAGDPTMKRPVFDMYSMDPKSGQTFWDRTKEIYQCRKEYRIDPKIDSEPVTIVLKRG